MYLLSNAYGSPQATRDHPGVHSIAIRSMLSFFEGKWLGSRGGGLAPRVNQALIMTVWRRLPRACGACDGSRRGRRPRLPNRAKLGRSPINLDGKSRYCDRNVRNYQAALHASESGEARTGGSLRPSFGLSGILEIREVRLCTARPSSTAYRFTPPRELKLAQECKGCVGTFCKGCHETGHPAFRGANRGDTPSANCSPTQRRFTAPLGFSPLLADQHRAAVPRSASSGMPAGRCALVRSENPEREFLYPDWDWSSRRRCKSL
jgi:hypothetical protein